jgi:hypothetical protein
MQSERLEWERDDEPLETDGQRRFFFTATAQGGQYRISPVYRVGLRFRGYMVAYSPDSKRAWHARRLIGGIFPTLDAAQAAAQCHSARLAKSA